MIRRRVAICVLVAVMAFLHRTATGSSRELVQTVTPQSHIAWVVASLERMERIKPGMTRADLLEVFTPDGGLQTDRTFVLRDCRYFKVSVEWEPTGRKPTGSSAAERIAFLDGQPRDVIRTISKPFIERMHID